MTTIAENLSSLPAPAELAAAPPGPASLAWSPARRLLFRFGFVYWLLFCFPLFMNHIMGFDWLMDPYQKLWRNLCLWVGPHVLRIGYEIPTRSSGSGDATISYIRLFCYLVLAATAATVWSIADRRSIGYPRLQEGLRIVVRYTLAFVLLHYGISKLFRGQFPLPEVGRLNQRYGDSSPMGLLWT